MTGASLQKVESNRGPFDLGDDLSYRAWRERKLAAYPRSIHELVVEIADPAALTPTEHAAIRERCARANMAIYVLTGAPRDVQDRSHGRLVGSVLSTSSQLSVEGVAR